MAAKTDDILIAIKGDIKNLDASMVTAQKKIDHLVKKTRRASRQMENPISKIGTYVKSYIGLQAGAWFLKFTGDIDSVKKSFNSLGADVEGGSKKLLQDIKTAARGTVAELDIMRSTNLAISLMGKEVTEQLPEMMKIARVAARTQGESVQQMYNDIIVASGRQSVMILDNLGISSATAARYQEEYAKKLGKTRQQLNATQKRAAFFYAVMKAGGDLMDMTGAATLSMGERLQVVKARAKDAAATFAEKLTPGLEEFITVLTETDGKIGESLLSTIGDAVNDLMVLFSRLINQIKYMPEAYRQAWQDIKDTFSFDEGRRFAAQWRSKQVQLLNEWAENDPSYAAKLMKENWDLMKSYGFSEEYLTGGYRLLRGSSKYSKYRKSNDEASRRSGRGRHGGEVSGTGGSGSKKGKWKWSEYYSMMGNEKEAELAKLQEKFLQYYEKNREYFVNHEEDMYALREQYRQRALAIEEKYDAAARAMKEGLTSAAKSAMSSFESATKDALKNSLLGKGGWKEWGKAIKEILAGLIADIVYAIAKALVLRAITSAIGGGGGLLLGGIFEKGRVPVFEAGHIPVYAGGRIPDDHFIAAIGKREAVITAEATRNNQDLLQEMNRTGDRLGMDVTVHSVATLDGAVIFENVEKRREETASLMGARNYHRENVNR